MKAKMGLLLFVVLMGAGAAYGSRVDRVDATRASPLFARSLDQAIAKFDGRAPTSRMRSAKRARFTAITPTYDSAPTCLAAPTCSVSCGAPTCDNEPTCLAAATCSVSRSRPAVTASISSTMLDPVPERTRCGCCSDSSGTNRWSDWRLPARVTQCAPRTAGRGAM